MEQADAAESVKKETYIHKMLRHPHIIRFYAIRQETTRNYIFLEYAAGGELFNKIGIASPLRKSELIDLLDFRTRRGNAVTRSPEIHAAAAKCRRLPAQARCGPQGSETGEFVTG